MRRLCEVIGMTIQDAQCFESQNSYYCTHSNSFNSTTNYSCHAYTLVFRHNPMLSFSPAPVVGTLTPSARKAQRVVLRIQTSERGGKTRHLLRCIRGRCLREPSNDTPKKAKLHGRQCPLRASFFGLVSQASPLTRPMTAGCGRDKRDILRGKSDLSRQGGLSPTSPRR